MVTATIAITLPAATTSSLTTDGLRRTHHASSSSSPSVAVPGHTRTSAASGDKAGPRSRRPRTANDTRRPRLSIGAGGTGPDPGPRLHRPSLPLLRRSRLRPPARCPATTRPPRRSPRPRGHVAHRIPRSTPRRRFRPHPFRRLTGRASRRRAHRPRQRRRRGSGSWGRSGRWRPRCPGRWRGMRRIPA